MKYRIWLKNITLQSTVVSAPSEAEARAIVEKQIKHDVVGFEDVEKCKWEVSSIDKIL